MEAQSSGKMAFVGIWRSMSMAARSIVTAAAKTAALWSFIVFALFSVDCNAAEARDDARAVVQSLLTCWQSNDYATFASLLHDDVRFAYPGGRLDKSQLLALFRSYHQEKRDIRVYFWDHFFLSGERFFTAYQFAATDVKSGKRQAVGTGVAGEIKDGKIVLLKEYYDNEVAWHQYEGNLPLDEGTVMPWPARVWLRPDTID
jgi:ketosteroid isomerase-like protein